MEKDQSHLRLLPAGNPNAKSEGSVQHALFPMTASSRTVAFVQLGTSQERSLIELLDWIRPRWVIDLRPVPRFDYGTLSRRRVFAHLDRLAAVYHDMFATLGFQTRSQAQTHIDVIAEAVAQVVGQPGAVMGPIVVLVDEPPSREETTTMPRRLLEKSPGKKWDVFVA
jgi:hypothetical protein